MDGLKINGQLSDVFFYPIISFSGSFLFFRPDYVWCYRGYTSHLLKVLVVDRRDRKTWVNGHRKSMEWMNSYPLRCREMIQWWKHRFESIFALSSTYFKPFSEWVIVSKYNLKVQLIDIRPEITFWSISILICYLIVLLIPSEIPADAFQFS